MGLSGLNLRVLVPYLPALGWGALRTVEISALWHRSCRRRYLCCLGLSTWKSSNQSDWTSKYPAIADAATALPLGSAYTDGESCGVRADGITSFSLIQNASDTRNGEALVIFQFDLLHVDGEDPSALPLVERKAS